MRTPTADELLANEEWVRTHKDIKASYLRIVAEGQAERAKKYFSNLAECENSESVVIELWKVKASVQSANNWCGDARGSVMKLTTLSFE